MKTCMEWPEESLLAACPALHASVMEQIIEPFSSVEEARAFWVETGCSMVIIEQGGFGQRISGFATAYPESGDVRFALPGARIRHIRRLASAAGHPQR